MLPRLAALLAMLLVFACGAPAPAPGGGEAPALREYRISPGDKIRVTVFGHADVSGEVEVNAAGAISVPLIGDVKAADRTVAQIQGEIAERLDRDYIVKPRVTVEILSYRPFFILGQVTKPGSYPYASGLDVRQAVAIGGGFTRRARTDTVVITRETDRGRESFDAPQDAPVLPGDTIEVDRRLF